MTENSFDDDRDHTSVKRLRERASMPERNVANDDTMDTMFADSVAESNVREDARHRREATITIHPMENQQLPSPLTEADRETMAECDQKVMEWLEAAPENRALFVVDHSRALRAALPDADPDFLDRIERANRRAKRATGPVAQPDFDAIEVKVPDTQD